MLDKRIATKKPLDVPNLASVDAFEESSTEEELDSEESESSDELEESSESDQNQQLWVSNLASLRGSGLVAYDKKTMPTYSQVNLVFPTTSVIKDSLVGVVVGVIDAICIDEVGIIAAKKTMSHVNLHEPCTCKEVDGSAMTFVSDAQAILHGPCTSKAQNSKTVTEV
ncbi:hypothetical protein ACH5RR_015618 [Cinchona calisaya]|uniref:Uncharacterized protein n=1 Tax=Cinchona calisaya TaxID=153742 RepID=A0ABD2ZUI8_9GENT